MRSIFLLPVNLSLVLSYVGAFTALSQPCAINKSMVLCNAGADQIDQELAKARELLAAAKEQLSAMENGTENPQSTQANTTPFFAKENDKRESVVKSKNDEGLITVNGDKMAKLSEEESWEARRLGEVFENELDEDEDVYSLASKQLGERDVAASIWNLRKTMQTEDYKRIFDKNNRFIGEDI
mmetsp:Transcript_9910/g.15234  ORF Transcript_9910/g.15234 Transcript_9910/m.15234 type:complete len:183 (-) Transcript_9910:633-1181(-)|eukprot:CAMPEP_0178932350 /NCGR_PEP_ID=MMETSP0786-20121207/22537_1 /TAXON_ID=186022 /ORGANISM="Thalassionema frauenfeldii, Strain CCMP 1798" /LENGTH=182 /DNA_ID=CAMNT_0020609569 /DNA_START=191 /DNA_END=739 /DNA_ORIENTATION=-